jgi:hypothetical protein
MSTLRLQREPHEYVKNSLKYFKMAEQVSVHKDFLIVSTCLFVAWLSRLKYMLPFGMLSIVACFCVVTFFVVVFFL